VESASCLSKVPALGFFNNYQPTVEELGSNAQSYKVVYRTDARAPGTNLHLAYLVVKTFAFTAEKPFILLDGGNVYAGLCK